MEEGGRWEEKGGKGVSRSPAWQAVRAAVGRTRVPSPLTHPMQAGGPAACSLSRASRLLPAPCQSCSGTRSQPVCRQEAALPPAPPAPFMSMCLPHPRHDRHLGRLTHVCLTSSRPCAPVCTSPLPSVYPQASPHSPPLHMHFPGLWSGTWATCVRSYPLLCFILGTHPALLTLLCAFRIWLPVLEQRSLFAHFTCTLWHTHCSLGTGVFAPI